MQTQITKEEAKAKVAELRKGYAKLKALCGPNGISLETIKSYREAIQRLEAQIN